MNAKSNLLLIFLLTTFIWINTSAQTELQLIAHYPLAQDGNDITGNNGPCYLNSTVFEESSVFCNGVYYEGAIGTPTLTNFKFESFAVTINFKVPEIPSGIRPLLIGGGLWRWIGAWIKADTTFCCNSNDRNINSSCMKYQINVWHEAKITYDSASGMGYWYLDNVKADSANFQIVHGNDRNFHNTHYGMSATFKGWLKDLKIYSVGNPSAVDDFEIIPDYSLEQNYPNPFNPSTTISYKLQAASYVTLKVYDVLGNEIATLVNENKSAGKYEVTFIPENLSSGIYFYQFSTANKLFTKKMTYVK